jgi:hypothetical protein
MSEETSIYPADAKEEQSMMSVLEKRHQQGCGPFTYNLPTKNLDEKGEQGERRTSASYRGSGKYY